MEATGAREPSPAGQNRTEPDRAAKCPGRSRGPRRAEAAEAGSAREPLGGTLGGGSDSTSPPRVCRAPRTAACK